MQQAGIKFKLSEPDYSVSLLAMLSGSDRMVLGYPAYLSGVIKMQPD